MLYLHLKRKTVATSNATVNGLQMTTTELQENLQSLQKENRSLKCQVKKLTDKLALLNNNDTLELRRSAQICGAAKKNNDEKINAKVLYNEIQILEGKKRETLAWI